IQDMAGQPVPGATVTARLLKHAFGFGGSVKAGDLVAPSQNSQIQKVVSEWFNRVVFENDLKWGNWPANQSTVQAALTWLEQYNIPARGHNLVWPIHDSPADGYSTAAALLAGLNQ